MTLTPGSHRDDLGPGFDQDDFPSNDTAASSLAEIVEARLSRRGVLAGGMVAAASFLTTSLARPDTAVAAPPTSSGGGGGGGPAGPLLGFAALQPSTADEVVVAPGYRTSPLIPWGTPILGSLPAFVPGTPGEKRRDGTPVTAGNTAAQQAEQIGMNHDGMTYFPLASGARGNEHGLLVLNHEYTDDSYLHTGEFVKDYRPTTAEGVRKAQNAHGVSVVEIRKSRDGRWAPVRSRTNRRITAHTPMAFSGPAAGHPLLKTTADPSGRAPLGTINNCGNGETLWGTYLTCEENFNGYFRVDGAQTPENAALQKRYNVGGDGYGWAVHDPRFRVTTENANEPNRFGWVVEIDPFDPQSTPVKRTALGRLKHEDASMVISKGGRVVVYMGDDQVFEYAYKFVSKDNWKSMRARGRSPLDEGTLYVAKFSDDGSGQWIPLVHGQNGLTAANGFPDQGAVLVNARQAATIVGATPMDRPEWTAVDERTGTVYLTLTNNSGRKLTDDPATPYDDRPNAANPRVNNRNGQVIRWDERRGDHAATTQRPRSTGTCSSSQVRGSPAVTAPPSTPKTRSARPTDCGWTRTAAPGSRPTALSPSAATTRCWPPTRRSTRTGRRSGASWSASRSARSPAWPPRPTGAPCSSTCSTRARTVAARGHAWTASRCRARPLSSSRRTTAA